MKYYNIIDSNKVDMSINQPLKSVITRSQGTFLWV